MNDLQWALLAASAVAVGGVWLYNLWQERQHAKAANRLFKSSQEDLLLSGGNPAANPADSQTDMGHSDTDIQRSDTDLSTSPPANEFQTWADPRSDCLIYFDLATDVAAPAIWAAQSTWSSSLTKSLRYLARESATNAWRLIEANDTGRYSHWLAALQLADRNGAISDNELLVFFDGMQQLGVQLNTTITVPGRTETLLRAQQLDDFCAGVDIQFSLQLVEAQGGSFVGTKLRGVCEAAGLQLQDDGCFHALSATGTTEYRVKNSSAEIFTVDNLRSLATNAIVLVLDVPRVADGAAAFDRMVGTARQLERGLGGKLVDAQRAALADELILGIRNKIAELQKVMHGADMAPGGLLATKLFN
ncbi:MAG: cell division protein ZipA C-terminal FtsZ-binding domain-containing protein [Rhodocyclaceae bacterium]|nr:cell division protein ZipA C-terminal FtsZ-binding domain-containing protein [Rhodocyclaceae bacterium]